MTALFLGEIFYLFIENRRLGLLICNGILLLIITTLARVVFKLGRKSYPVYIPLLLCLILLSGVNTGYHICSSYLDKISQMENRFEDKENLYIEGRISDVEEKTNSRYCYVESASVSGGGRSMKVQQLVLIIKGQDNETELLIPGNYICASVSYYALACARNDGGFDEKEYYYSIGISGKCTVTDYEVKTGHSLYDRVSKTLYKVKRSMGRKIDRLSAGHYAGIYKGILLGEKSAVPEDTKELYKAAGISHLLSISGLHISLIGYFVYKWLRKYRGIAFSAALSMAVICLYGMMTGGGFSTKRAIIMFGVNIAADVWGRTYDLISALSLSFIIIMVTNPLCIFHSGFLLSFGAILGIQPLYSLVADYLGIRNKWMKSWIAGICINAMTRPVIIHTFHEFSLYSSLINLPVIFLMGIMVSCGFMSVFISYIWFGMGKIIFCIGCRILGFYELLCRQFLRFPSAVMIVKSPAFVRIVIYYLVIVFFMVLLIFLKHRKKKREEQKQKVRYIIVGMVNALLFVIITYCSNRNLEVKMIDVGQGDSIYLNIKGKHVLIDAGSSSERDITKYTILPFLKANGVNQIDYLIMTHSDSDHAGGMAELLNQKHNGNQYVKNLILPDIGENIRDTLYTETEALAAKNNVNIIYFSSGCSIRYEDVKLNCIWPYKGADTADKNNLSIVLKLESENFSMLFTGDLSEDGEKGILHRQEALEVTLEDVDILKVGHHGSDGSSCMDFISLLRPKVSLISCGINNTYGHPGKQAVNRLCSVKSDIFVTTKAGQINIIVKDRGFCVETFLH